jgi:hypothetical protein
VVRRGFRYARGDFQKSLLIIETACFKGHQPACKTFISLVREGINQQTMQPTDDLKNRVLKVQNELKKD